MNNIEKQAREDVFNSYPLNIQQVFSGRHDDIFNDSKVFRLFQSMNLLAFGTVKSADMVTNQAEDYEYANGVDLQFVNGKPVFKGVKK